MKYQLLLVLNEKSIILEEGTQEKLQYMLNWYNAHKEYFNGVFKIVEMQ